LVIILLFNIHYVLNKRNSPGTYLTTLVLIGDIWLAMWPNNCSRQNAEEQQEAQMSLRDRATRACQLKSCKLLHKCRRLAFEKP